MRRCCGRGRKRRRRPCPHRPHRPNRCKNRRRRHLLLLRQFRPRRLSHRRLSPRRRLLRQRHRLPHLTRLQLTTPPAPPPLPAAKTLPVVAPTPPSPAPPTPEPATPAQPKQPVLKSDGWKNPFSLTPAPEAPSSPALPRPPVETKKLPGSAAASPETAAIAETITDAGSPADNDSATTGPTANEWRVQFAAFRNAREAERALEKLNSRAGAEIGRTPRIIDVTDLGDRGIFHRIQAGPLDGREAAEKLCTLVKAVLPQQGCVPVQIKGR